MIQVDCYADYRGEERWELTMFERWGEWAPDDGIDRPAAPSSGSGRQWLS